MYLCSLCMYKCLCMYCVSTHTPNQTWDLLRIMYYGFKGLVEDFLATHQGYHINPKRMNGIETLFSQLKHTTGGHLCGANYEAAKAMLLTHKQTKGRIAQQVCTLHNQNYL